MAIAFRATGAWTDNNAGTLGLTIPAGAVAGDLMVAFVGGKPFSSVLTINQSWNNGGGATDGTTNAGGNTGSMQARIFWKIHTGTETNPTVSITSNNVYSGVIVVFSKDAASFWDLAFGGGGDDTAGTAFSATTTNTISLTTNDWIAAFGASRSDNGTFGNLGISATGMVFGAFNSRPTANYATGTGGNMSARSGHFTATSGTSDSAITITSTLGASHTGSMFLVRMRESATDPLAASFDPFGMMGFFGI
jgi:hypothetical protein